MANLKVLSKGFDSYTPPKLFCDYVEDPASIRAGDIVMCPCACYGIYQFWNTPIDPGYKKFYIREGSKHTVMGLAVKSLSMSIQDTSFKSFTPTRQVVTLSIKPKEGSHIKVFRHNYSSQEFIYWATMFEQAYGRMLKEIEAHEAYTKQRVERADLQAMVDREAPVLDYFYEPFANAAGQAGQGAGVAPAPIRREPWYRNIAPQEQVVEGPQEAPNAVEELPERDRS